MSDFKGKYINMEAVRLIFVFLKLQKFPIFFYKKMCRIFVNYYSFS